MTSTNTKTSTKPDKHNYNALQIDFLDRLLDLDILDDKKGYYRNTQYLFGRKSRIIKRAEYRVNVVTPLIEQGLISEFRDYQYLNWGPSFEITNEGREYLKRQPIEPNRKEYLDDARKILRFIIKNPNKGIRFEDIVEHLNGRSRIIDETLDTLLVSNILDISANGYYILSGPAYLVYMTIKTQKTKEIEESIDDEDREKLENLLASLDDEDDDD